ncbi:cysteine peptidase family C39 domain-containing protein [Clostridium sp. Marseille-Q2269]
MRRFLNKYICIKQHDYKDCGCACLATIYKQYGVKYTSYYKIS